jgi:DNA-directed RNA polymerase specialized sigma24 family protein
MKPSPQDVAAVMAEMSMVRGVLRRCRLPADVVDDLAQDVAIGMWRAVDRGLFVLVHDAAGIDRLGAYMHGIAWRAAAGHRAREARHEGLPVIDGDNVGPDPHRRLEAREQLRWARGLPQHLRVPLWCFASGMSIEEISAALDVPYGAVWFRLRKARRLLRWWLRASRKAHK